MSAWVGVMRRTFNARTLYAVVRPNGLARIVRVVGAIGVMVHHPTCLGAPDFRTRSTRLRSLWRLRSRMERLVGQCLTEAVFTHSRLSFGRAARRSFTEMALPCSVLSAASATTITGTPTSTSPPSPVCDL